MTIWLSDWVFTCHTSEYGKDEIHVAHGIVARDPQDLLRAAAEAVKEATDERT